MADIEAAAKSIPDPHEWKHGEISTLYTLTGYCSVFDFVVKEIFGVWSYNDLVGIQQVGFHSIFSKYLCLHWSVVYKECKVKEHNNLLTLPKWLKVNTDNPSEAGLYGVNPSLQSFTTAAGKVRFAIGVEFLTLYQQYPCEEQR